MKTFLVSIIVLVLTSCSNLNKLPNEKYYEFMYYFERSFKNDSVIYNIKNPLMCPINIKLVNDKINLDLDTMFGHFTLNELRDTIIKIKYPNFDDTSNSKYIVRYGDLNKKILKNKINLPFPKGKKYKVIQGYNGKFTHNGLYSQYAIDFNLKIGDTITSVDKGYVVGLIEDYSKYGTSKKWLENDKSNYITIYHPHSGLYSQYVHLNHKGALVKLGDFVREGQPIGITGMTGFTTTPHLHFNVKIPTMEYGLISTEIEFTNGIPGNKMLINEFVE